MADLQVPDRGFRVPPFSPKFCGRVPDSQLVRIGCLARGLPLPLPRDDRELAPPGMFRAVYVLFSQPNSPRWSMIFSGDHCRGPGRSG
jgi:hypothetical protein